jgi:hypothetical protein
MNNSTLVMVAVLAAVAMLSAAVVVLPIQKASAQDTNFDFTQYQSNRCSGATECSNAGTITLTPFA